MIHSLTIASLLLLSVACGRDGCVRHAFTHRDLRLHVYRCENPNGRVRLNGFDAHKWLSPSRFDALAKGAATKKALGLIQGR